MKHSLLCCALGAASLAGCDVATVQQAQSSIALNQCESDSECPGGFCSANQCRSRQGTLAKALFSITPPAGTSPSAGVQFLKQVDLESAGGELPLPLDAVVQVTGKVTVSGYKCSPQFDDRGAMLVTAPDASIPIVISLTPSAGALGVYAPAAVVQTTLIGNSYFGFSVDVPPGNYDVYVQPLHQDEETCIVPPQLRRAYPIEGDQLVLEIPLPKPASFEFHVSWPLGDGALNGWTVDMLDPVSGRVISNRAQLAVSSLGKTDYVATIYYLPVLDDTSLVKAQELVRLSPPAGTVAPSALLARSALGLFDANRGTLGNLTSLPASVNVKGQVTNMATPEPVAATVTLVATKIDGIDPGVLASFVRVVNVGANGQFELDVLPGTYRVSAVPSGELDSASAGNNDPKLAAATQEWQVAASPSKQAGKVIELNQALPINGQAFDASFSTPLTTALVQAVASSASVKTDVLHEALGEGRSVPRAGTGSVTESGDFSLLGDSGMFDVSVRPLAATGFAWLVVPGVGVGTSADTSAGANLGTRGLPLPVLYRGTVTKPGSDAGRDRVPGALIRAYVYTSSGDYTADASKADSLVQIAETRASTSGDYELLIPATLNGSTR